MPWRFTSSKKTPSPCTSRLSSLRGTFVPAKPGVAFSRSATTGPVTVSVTLTRGKPCFPRGPPSSQVPRFQQMRGLRRGATRLRPIGCHPRSDSRNTLPRSSLDGLHNVHVAGAAANIPLNGLADLVLARCRVRAQERRRAHQHPRRAVAALERVVVGERLLQRRQLAVARE